MEQSGEGRMGLELDSFSAQLGSISFSLSVLAALF